MRVHVTGRRTVGFMNYRGAPDDLPMSAIITNRHIAWRQCDSRANIIRQYGLSHGQRWHQKLS